MYTIFKLFLVFILLGCKESPMNEPKPIINLNASKNVKSKVSLIVLGTMQDAGAPHIGCQKKCCEELFTSDHSSRKVVSLGIVDTVFRRKYLFEATPDMPVQMNYLANNSYSDSNPFVDGVFISHGHIGHYTGLMYFGKEAAAVKRIKVYAMKRMQEFLSANGPWDRLVKTENIILQPLKHEKSIVLTANLQVTPFLVPHRDEYTETVGFRIKGPNKTALFIPDIDKWTLWEKNIVEEIEKVDYAFLDATFFSGSELNNRDMSQVPHPFVLESLQQFKSLSPKDRSKVYFIHFNHSNPVLDKESEQAKMVLDQGYNFASINSIFDM
ncbi:MAG: MBL fold metallo-hydrolase [Flavicella sp.]